MRIPDTNQSRQSQWVRFGLPVLIAMICSTISGCGTAFREEPPLSEVTSVHVLTDANFAAEVLDNPQPVLVDAWASWCHPCLEMKPVLQKLSAEFAGQVKIGELDVEANRFTAEKYDVESLPTILIFHEGTVVRRLVGLHTQAELTEAFNAVLKSRQLTR